MKLREFIAQTLLDVVEGVATAQEALGQGKGAISPAHGPHNPYQNIDFDLAIAAEDDASGKVNICVVRSGTTEVPRGQRSDISRIQVTVPVRLPSGKQ